MGDIQEPPVLLHQGQAVAEAGGTVVLRRDDPCGGIIDVAPEAVQGNCSYAFTEGGAVLVQAKAYTSEASPESEL